MELQHLRYFLDVARLESISRAAEKNLVAQPAGGPAGEGIWGASV